ncbi:MAG TPA: lysine biosynthesis protein LysW [Anaerolinea thermolimosa]|uniref:Lysine biosynthesis protein LysW n=1 Tax=Anaerolinea thermolimosa TaxID=229919 RepID=A0A3D1JKN1_9CHLR|nr:lysine biosynthesis protein LysW [Anaerolinea thermolimosa]
MPEDDYNERPLTACAVCSAEVDLSWAEVGERVVCTVCGAGMLVVSLEPPEVEAEEE